MISWKQPRLNFHWPYYLGCLALIPFVWAFFGQASSGEEIGQAANTQQWRSIYVECRAEDDSFFRSRFGKFFSGAKDSYGSEKSRSKAQRAKKGEIQQGDLDRFEFTLQYDFKTDLELLVLSQKSARFFLVFEAAYFGPEKCEKEYAPPNGKDEWDALLRSKKADAVALAWVYYLRKEDRVEGLGFLYGKGFERPIVTIQELYDNVEDISDFLRDVTESTARVLDATTDGEYRWIAGDFPSFAENPEKLLSQARSLLAKRSEQSLDERVKFAGLIQLYLQRAIKFALATGDPSLANDASRELGLELLRNRRTDEALAYLEPVLGDPSNLALSETDRTFATAVLFAAGQQYLSRGRTEPGIREIRLALDYSPNNPNLLLRSASAALSAAEDQRNTKFGEGTLEEFVMGQVNEYIRRAQKTAESCPVVAGNAVIDMFYWSDWEDQARTLLERVRTLCKKLNITTPEEVSALLDIASYDRLLYPDVPQSSDAYGIWAYDRIIESEDMLLDSAISSPDVRLDFAQAKNDRAWWTSELIELGWLDFSTLPSVIDDYESSLAIGGCSPPGEEPETSRVIEEVECQLNPEFRSGLYLNLLEAGVLSGIDRYRDLGSNPYRADLFKCMRDFSPRGSKAGKGNSSSLSAGACSLDGQADIIERYISLLGEILWAEKFSPTAADEFLYGLDQRSRQEGTYIYSIMWDFTLPLVTLESLLEDSEGDQRDRVQRALDMTSRFAEWRPSRSNE